MQKIKERISALRVAMSQAGLSACVIPGTDPHASEYIADCWKEREWITGFTGSAGNVVFTMEKAGLWTDSRYFLQAASQLEGSGVELMRIGLPNTPDIVNWLKQHLHSGAKLGVNPLMFSVKAYHALQNELRPLHIELVNVDLLASVWLERPGIPSSSCFLLDRTYAGESVASKLSRLRVEMAKLGAGIMVVSALDEIAWLFNIRGKDVPYNPVAVAYALVTAEESVLFISPSKLGEELIVALNAEGVSVRDYMEVYDMLKTSASSMRILYDGNKLNRKLYEAFPSASVAFDVLSPIARLKSVKNEVELSGFRRAMLKDGVALTRFFKWLEENVASGNLTEMSVDEQLTKYRMNQENAMGASFHSISAYGAHGAIVHYCATPDIDSILKPEGIYLLDSGGQYLDGTTDITRTISLGKPTPQQKTDFTLVLKGNIALNQAIFPVNTRGSQLDVLARQAMWKKGLNYGHGTGHGVGHFLNVHEGPQSIRVDENPVALEPGMVVSNEPGLYREKQYGIRIENMLCVVPALETAFGKFLGFETLTWCYLDKMLIDFECLEEAEIEWIDRYHQKVYQNLSPLLTTEEREWLYDKCKPCLA